MPPVREPPPHRNRGQPGSIALQKFISRFNASEPNQEGHCAKIAL
jgi:hypothetical protein